MVMQGSGLIKSLDVQVNRSNLKRSLKAPCLLSRHRSCNILELTILEKLWKIHIFEIHILGLKQVTTAKKSRTTYIIGGDIFNDEVDYLSQ